MIRKVQIVMILMNMQLRKKVFEKKQKRPDFELPYAYWLLESMRTLSNRLFQILLLRMPSMGLQAIIVSNSLVFVRLINFWHNTSPDPQTLRIRRYLRPKNWHPCSTFPIPSTIASPRYDGKISKS